MGHRTAHRFELQLSQFIEINFNREIKVENWNIVKVNYCLLWWNAVMIKKFRFIHDVAISVTLIANNIVVKLYRSADWR